MALNDVDPWGAATNDPAASAGQLPRVNTSTITTPGYESRSSGNTQTANGGTRWYGPSTSTVTTAADSGYAPPAAAPQQSYAPMGGDLGFDATAPGTGENVSAALLEHYGANGIPGTSQNAQGAYAQFQQSTPADMSAYYNNASRNASNAINTQMAARGSYGSSNAMGVLSNAETNLRAQQAKDEAGYGLQRAGLAGSLASGADNSSAAHSADERNWVNALSDLGFKNQREGAARFTTGYGIANDLADKASGIESSAGTAEIQAQEDLLAKQLMAQGMSASDASTAAHSTVAAQNASDARAVDTAEKTIQSGAMMFV